MPPFRRLHLAVLLALLLAALPAARPALALTFTVTDLGDVDELLAGSCGSSCTLREAIRLANDNPGPDTIAFSFPGNGPHVIAPASGTLPALTDGGTTIDGTNLATGAVHQVVLSGAVLAAGPGIGHGLVIRGSNIEVRGLVIGGFPRGDSDLTSGSAIFIDGETGGGDSNRIFNNRIGVTADGATAFNNGRYGVRLALGADNNRIGGTGAGQGNVIAGGGTANVGVGGAGETTSNVGNEIAGNLIGTNAAGTERPVNVNTDSTQGGINIDAGAVDTVIDGNLIGGLAQGAVENPVIAGIFIAGLGTSPTTPRIPTGTVIVRNLIGVNSAGAAVPNRVGISLGGGANYGPYNTTIGDPADPVGGRNIIAGNLQVGVEVRETTFKFGDVTIAGNSIGVDRGGNPLPNGVSGSGAGGEGIRVGRFDPAQPGANGRVTVGPGNVIASNITFGLRFRSGGHTVRGNLFGTDVAGNASALPVLTPSYQPRTANGAASIWIENGDGITIGGPTAADRNVIAFSGSTSGRVGVGILIDPDAADVAGGTCGAQPCTTGGHTIRGNYIGVRADGSAALNSNPSEQAQREGIRLFRTSGNQLRDNVVSGIGAGIVLGGSIAGVAYPANGNTISGNRIGTRASGLTTGAVGIGNREEGIRLLVGTGNRIEGNLIAFNGTASITQFIQYHGILVGSPGTAANDNDLVGNRLLRNGNAGNGNAILVDTADAVTISRSETSTNQGNGIALANGGNSDRAAPTISTIVAGSPPIAGGTTAGCDGCTVEIFGSTTSEPGEGPVFIASGVASGTSFSIPVPGCQRFLTATVTDAAGNTSPFSAVLDSGPAGPCVAVTGPTLDPASPSSRNVAPGTSTTYTHRLSHTTQAERTYTIQITSTLGWASGPAFVTLPAAPAGGSTSTTFDVTVAVPLGAAAGTQDITTLRAVLGSLSSAQQTDTTTAQPVALNPASPEVSPGQTQPYAPGTVTFVHTVTNTGDLTGSFEVIGPQIVGSPPGFSIASATLGRISIPGRQSTQLTIVVTTPPTPPTPGNVTVRFAVGVVGGARTPDVDDLIAVAAVRGFTFTPEAPQTATTPAGANVAIDYVLTNTGNAADSFTVTGQPTGAPNPLTLVGVAATPALTNLAAGASASVRVTFRVPPGTTAASYGVSVTAQGTGGASPPAAVTRTATVDVTGGGAATILAGPGTPNPVDVRGAAGSVTFTNLVTNTGNAAVPILVPATFTTGLPAGWGATTTANSCDDTPTIAPGAECSFTVTVSVAADADAGAYTVRVTATADNSAQAPRPPDVTAEATNVVNVLRVRGVLLEPDNALEGPPGALLTFTHTLTNTGNGADSFDLGAAPALPGWSVLITPSLVLDVPRGATREVVVTARVPAVVQAGAANSIIVTATAVGGTASDTATDLATAQTITAADLSPGGIENLDAGATITFTHTLTNTGTTLTAFTVASADSSPGWSSQVSPSPTGQLAPGETTTISVAVTAPITATAGLSNTTSLQVLAAGTTTPVLDEEQDLSLIGPDFGVLITPDNIGTALPGTTAVFTHTLTNIGTTQGVISLSAAEANGWPVSVTPNQVNLGAGVTIPVTLTVSIPLTARATQPGQLSGFARVTAQLESDPLIRDDATNTINVGRVFGVDLSASQARLVDAGGPPQPLSGLLVRNIGNGLDTFDLNTTGVPAGWTVLLQPRPVQIVGGGRAVVDVQVLVPADLPPRTITTIVVTARSRARPSASDTVELTLVYDPPQRTVIYLPIIRQRGDPE